MAKQTFTSGQVLSAAQMTSLQQTAMGGGSATPKTASYVLVAADAGTVIQMNSASATTITVNTSLFAAGDSVQIINIGAGVCTITAGTATVTTAGTLALSQWAGGELYFSSTSASIFRGATAAAASGGMTEIASGSLTGTTVVISSIPTTYNSLRLVVRNFKPIVDNCNMRMRFNNDSTANRHLADSSSTGVSTRAFDATFSSISYSADNTSASGLAIVDIPDYANTTTWKTAFCFSAVNSGTSATTANAYWNMQGYNQTGAITSLGLFEEGSGFTSGTYILYGVK